MRAALVALFIAASCCACSSPTEPDSSNIVGDWRALSFPSIANIYWNIRIEVENGQLTGRACLTASGKLPPGYDNLPVTVTARHLSATRVAFVDPLGHTWSGVLNEGTNLVINGGGGRPLYKNGDYCASAR